MKNLKPAKRRQFSLLEIIIAISIVALIAAIAVPNLLGQAEGAKVDACKTEISNLKNAVITFKTTRNKWPSSFEELTQGSPGNAPLLKSVPKDPWDNEYTFEVVPESFDGFEIVSFGADGQSGGEGFNADIKLSEIK